MKKLYIITAVILLLSMMLSSCSKYNDSWIIGKNSDEIQEKYGEFTFCRGSPSEDGLYYDCICGYKLQDQVVEDGVITLYMVCYMIRFDSEGQACEIQDDYVHIDSRVM